MGVLPPHFGHNPRAAARPSVFLSTVVLGDRFDTNTPSEPPRPNIILSVCHIKFSSVYYLASPRCLGGEWKTGGGSLLPKRVFIPQVSVMFILPYEPNKIANTVQ